MYVIVGATGHTGAVVAKTLLEQKLPVRVVVRDAPKGAEWKQRGAEVAVAALDDAKAVAEALRGAEGAYLMVPPNYTSNTVLGVAAQGDGRAGGGAAPQACRALVVGGRRASVGHRTIVGVHYAEEKLQPDATG